MKRSWVLKELNYQELRDKKFEVAVLPIGSTEPHGLHLPYGTDALLAEMIAGRICERVHNMGGRVILLPAISYGVNSNLLKFPMTIHLSPTTHLEMIKDIVKSLEAHEIPKLVFFNAHGGNDFEWIMRQLYGKTKLFLVYIDWWKVGKDKQKEIFESDGEHANELETSVALELFPELVNLEVMGTGEVRKSRFEAINKGWACVVRPWHILTRDSGYGDPRKSSKEKGKKYLDIVIERLSKFIYELCETPIERDFPY